MRLSARPLIVTTCAAVISTVWLAPDAGATLTHYVPFDTGYTAGNLLNGAGGSDLGFGANTWFEGGNVSTTPAGSLPGAGLPSAGGHASTVGPGFTLAFYTMDQDGDSINGEPEDALGPGVHWLSLVARSDAGTDFAGFSFVQFFGPEILYIGKVNGPGSNEWGFDQGTGGSSAVAGSDATVDTLLVVRLTIGPGDDDDFADLYVNPAIGSAPPGAPDIANYAFNEEPGADNPINEIRLGSQTGSFYADEIRIGSTWADVVPEPASLTLLGLGALVIARRRRR